MISEVGVECARQCALNALAAIASVVDLTEVKRVVKVVAFVASTPEFTGQPQIANGASELLGQVFGDNGQHARSAVGVPVLPLDARRGRVTGDLRSRPLTGRMAEAALAYARGGSAPAMPQPASTVILLRDANPSPHVYLLRRAASMAFAAGMSVFPGRRGRRVRGGRLDRADARLVRGAARLYGGRRLRGGRRAETFEESGVLLGRPRTRWSRTPPDRTGRTTGSRWKAGRCRSPTSCTGAGWCCGPTCSACGRTGSRPSSSLGGTTPGSSSPPCRRASAPGRVRRVGPGRVDGPGRSDRLVDAGEMAMLPPTYLCCAEVAGIRSRMCSPPPGIGVADPPRGCGSRATWPTWRTVTVETVTPRAVRVLAPNPSPMTLDGTNTWIPHPGGPALVVDPGPGRRPGARARDGRRAGRRGPAHPRTRGPLEGAAFASRAGCGVRALDPAHRLALKDSPTAMWSRPATCESTSSARAPPTRSRSGCRTSRRCSPATPCSAAVRRWSRTRTAHSVRTAPPARTRGRRRRRHRPTRPR